MKKNFTEKSRKALAGDLDAGEEVVGAVLGEPEGSLLSQMSSGKRVGLAAWDAKKYRETQDPDAMASIVGRKRQMITRTTSRVFFHDVGPTVGMKSLTLELPIEQVELNSVKVKRKQYVLVGFPDDSAKMFLCHHNQPIDSIGPLLEIE